MPAAWDNRVRSLECSTHSALYLYNDTGHEGDYVTTRERASVSKLGAVPSSYIYFGTVAEEEGSSPAD